MSLTYCDKFGFDDKAIAERLSWLELNISDHGIAHTLQHEIIQPQIDTLVEAFYDWLQTIQAAQALLHNKGQIKQLKKTQTQYLLELGINFDQADYFESRLRVGQAHVWVGLSLSLYHCAFRRLGELILDSIDSQREDAQALTTFVHKIIALDMSLAIETYHLTHVQTLQESLNRSKHQQEFLREAAATDSLTGLPNRETIIDELHKALLEPQRKDRPIIAIMADVDHFKQINDTHGHLIGDKVLIEITHRIRSALRDFDQLGRYGGEEFLLILNGAKLSTAQKVSERIRQHVQQQPINIEGLEVQSTISLGIAAAKTSESAESLMERADKALYAAKHAGRNCVITADN